MIKEIILLCSTIFFLSCSTLYSTFDLIHVAQFTDLAHNLFMGTALAFLPIVSGEKVYQAVTAPQFQNDNAPGSRTIFVGGSAVGYYLWFKFLNKLKEDNGEEYAYAYALMSLLFPVIVEHAVIKPMQNSVKG